MGLEPFPDTKETKVNNLLLQTVFLDEDKRFIQYKNIMLWVDLGWVGVGRERDTRFLWESHFERPQD